MIYQNNSKFQEFRILLKIKVNFIDPPKIFSKFLMLNIFFQCSRIFLGFVVLFWKSIFLLYMAQATFYVKMTNWPIIFHMCFSEILRTVHSSGEYLILYQNWLPVLAVQWTDIFWKKKMFREFSSFIVTFFFHILCVSFYTCLGSIEQI